MKKFLMILAMGGLVSLSACDPQTGKTTTDAATNAENTTANSSGIVNPAPNDTTGANATEITQTKVGNSHTRGEKNDSRSVTTQNQVIQDSL